MCLLWLPKEWPQNAQNAQKGGRFYALGLLATRYSMLATSRRDPDGHFASAEGAGHFEEGQSGKLLSEHLVPRRTVRAESRPPCLAISAPTAVQDFIVRVTHAEADAVLRSRSQIATLKRGANVKYPPYARTENGAIMAANLRCRRGRRPALMVSAQPVGWALPPIVSTVCRSSIYNVPAVLIELPGDEVDLCGGQH